MWVDRCGGEESSAEKLLNAGSVVTGFGTPTVCEVEEVDTVDMDNGEGPSAGLGVCAWVGGVVAKLVDITGLTEGGLLKISTVPFLCLPVCQNHAIWHAEQPWTYLYDVERVETVNSRHALPAKEFDRGTVKATVHSNPFAEFASIVNTHTPTF